MKESKPDIATLGIVGIAMIGGAICFPFFIGARLAYEASVVIGAAASRGNLVHELFLAAYHPFTDPDMAHLTVMGFVYALVPVGTRILPGELGKWAFRLTAGYMWVGLGLFLALGAVTAMVN